MTNYLRAASFVVLFASIIYVRRDDIKNRVAENLRSPKLGDPFGWLTQKIMALGNFDGSIGIVDVLNPPPNSIILEIGIGHGFSLRHLITNYQPSRVYGLEISEAFLSKARTTFQDEIKAGLLSIHGIDAKNIYFLEDSSVDGIYSFNVIYFLHPLDVYLKELYRILRPGSKIVFGVSDTAKSMSTTTSFMNTNWDECLDLMKAAGFESIEMKEVDNEKIGVRLNALIGWKPSTDEQN